MSTSIMAQEALSSPDVIAKQLVANRESCELLSEKIRQFSPSLVYVIGRGSSDHAGVFAKYLIEIELGIPVAAAAPSVSSIYNTQLSLEQALVIVISQSGRSPDILTQAQAAKNSGALCIALVNDQHSPLANMANFVLPLHAGEEKAIAATKSYLATLSALLQLVSHWKQDACLLDALDELPKHLYQAIDCSSQLNFEYLHTLRHCVVLGRGLGYAISREIALKLKEVCGIHAEAFSSAEFLHGPVTLVEKALSIIDVSVQDESISSHKQQIAEVGKRGATLIHLSQAGFNMHPRIAPLSILQRFYIDIECISKEMGLDPDNPVGLKKVTKTV